MIPSNGSLSYRPRFCHRLSSPIYSVMLMLAHGSASQHCIAGSGFSPVCRPNGEIEIRWALLLMSVYKVRGGDSLLNHLRFAFRENCNGYETGLYVIHLILNRLEEGTMPE